MGREKRLAQSRNKDILEQEHADQKRAVAQATAQAPVAAAPAHVAHTSTARAIFQILMLYLVPVLIIILIGKLIFKI